MGREEVSSEFSSWSKNQELLQRLFILGHQNTNHTKRWEGGLEALTMVLQTPIRTRWDTSTIRAVTTLGLPQQSVRFGAIPGNCKTKHHV